MRTAAVVRNRTPVDRKQGFKNQPKLKYPTATTDSDVSIYHSIRGWLPVPSRGVMAIRWSDGWYDTKKAKF